MTTTTWTPVRSVKEDEPRDLFNVYVVNGRLMVELIDDIDDCLSVTRELTLRQASEMENALAAGRREVAAPGL